MKTGNMKGITIVELLVVVAVAALLSGFAFLGVDMVQQERLNAAARELYADLQGVRLNAMTQNGKGYGIRFESAHTYVIFKFEDCNADSTYDGNTCPGGTREEQVIARRNLPSGIVIRKTNGSIVSNDVRIFDNFGSPRQANWGMGPMTILVRNSPDTGAARCVSISMNRIRESVWNGSECVM